MPDGSYIKPRADAWNPFRLRATCVDGLVKCKECGALFEASRAKDFCSDQHKGIWNNRLQSRGGAILRELMRWRYDRPRTKGIFGFICAQLAAWHDEDVAAGRSSW